MGEVAVAAGLIEALRRGAGLTARPAGAPAGQRDAVPAIHLTATTRTGRAQAQRLEAKRRLDRLLSSRLSRRCAALPGHAASLRAPSRRNGALAESPRGGRARGIPVLIANGRISDRALRRYRFVKALMARALSAVRLACVQTARDGERFEFLGLAGGPRPRRRQPQVRARLGREGSRADSRGAGALRGRRALARGEHGGGRGGGCPRGVARAASVRGSAPRAGDRPEAPRAVRGRRAADRRGGAPLGAAQRGEAGHGPGTGAARHHRGALRRSTAPPRSPSSAAPSSRSAATTSSSRPRGGSPPSSARTWRTSARSPRGCSKRAARSRRRTPPR